VYLQQGDPQLKAPTPTGGTIQTGIPIEELRERIGGDEGYLEGPTGERHFISIPPELPNGKGIVAHIRVAFVDAERRRKKGKEEESP
jgi:hypothetical protein